MSYADFLDGGCGTVADAATYLALSTGTVYRMVSAGKLPASRVGGVIRFRKADLDRYLDSKGTLAVVPVQKTRGPRVNASVVRAMGAA